MIFSIPFHQPLCIAWVHHFLPHLTVCLIHLPMYSSFFNPSSPQIIPIYHTTPGTPTQFREKRDSVTSLASQPSCNRDDNMELITLSHLNYSPPTTFSSTSMLSLDSRTSTSKTNLEQPCNSKKFTTNTCVSPTQKRIANLPRRVQTFRNWGYHQSLTSARINI